MIVKGQKINDRYQIIRTIGEGGMANVYLAHDTILDRDVAVKILRGDLADDEKFVRRFQREAISASSLSHPNIVEMYDVGEDDGQYYIVMEYVEGKTLKNLVKKRGALTLAEVIDIMSQLTSAISCAHNSYIIHRDIKPQNVLVKEDGTIKITDFGIAMALNSNELTQTNSVMGSVHYLPPEQANGNGATIKSDIYSMGILMFELLTGKLPFKGDNAVEIAIKQMKDQIPSVCQMNPDIPQSIENIVLKACAKNPKNRYDNVNEMNEDIKTCLDADRQLEKRIVYKYPDNDLDETKVIPNINKLKDNKDKTPVNKDDEEEPKKLNKILLILSIAGGALLLLLTVFLVVIPIFGNKKEVKVPDVAGMSIIDAESKLKELGFSINGENQYENSDTIKEGMVIKTNPQGGVSRKKGTSITIIVSSGENGVVLENYVGKNYLEIKGKLEASGLTVVINKKVYDDKTLEENLITEQTPTVGKKVVEGDTVTLTIPDVIKEYPDFKEEAWELTDIQAFCEEYSVNLNIVYETTTNYPAGTIISQSRAKGTRIVAGASLKIVIAQAPANNTNADDNNDNATDNTNDNPTLPANEDVLG